MKILRRKLVIRSFSIFLLVEILTNVIAPSVSWALTSGPTAPEATSFEPVDTTDMVNLATGDLVYNIPLLEVPGPSGGYPLSLSYHAGIMPNEEASWVGLGWTLNPGAITRSVNGFPDDFKNVTSYDRVYWEGGVTKTYTLGVTVGISDLTSVSAGMAISNDTYKGLGVGGYLGANVGLGDSPFSVGATVGISPFGGAYASAGLSGGVGTKLGENGAIGLSGSIGLSTNFQSISYNASAGGGVSISGGNAKSTLGAAISSDNGFTSGGSLSVGGGTIRINNSKSDNVSTESGGGSIDVPVLPAVSISLGYYFTRYWIDQTEGVETNGTLYNPAGSVVVTNFDTKAYDSYTLPGNLSSDDPIKEPGLSFLNADDYNVSAQGIAGAIRPYSFKNKLFKQNSKKQNVYEKKQYSFDAADYATGKIEFRFANDFSNRFISANETWSSSTSPLVAEEGLSTTGESGTDGLVNNKLLSSRNIDWYSNSEIKNNQATGLVECNATGFVRDSESLKDQIGGFKITNESGVTYHFALPAYAYDEYQYSENIKQTDGKTFNEFKKPSKYAYTWFLTAITGPDYVDRGATGKLDKEDWGYWVEFEYGKWTENYAWRNPSVGFDLDIDNNFKNYSSGKKEVYYLDAVRTKSHTALFVKDIRSDAKSSSVALDLQKKSDLGFTPTDYTSKIVTKRYDPQTCDYKPRDYTTTTAEYSHKTYPVSLLKLSKIYLLKNSDLESAISSGQMTNLNDLKSRGNTFNFQIVGNKKTTVVKTSWVCCDIVPENPVQACTCSHCEHVGNAVVTNTPVYIDLHSGDNMMMTDDIEGLSSFKTNSLRIVQLSTSNTIVPETINSFTHASLYSPTPPTSPSSYVLEGKLTLDAVSLLGKGGVELMPKMRFSYELDNMSSSGTGSISTSNGQYILYSSNSGLAQGDIITISNGSFAFVKSVSGSSYYLKIIGKNLPVAGVSSWKLTKNPPFNKDYYDMWGLYKPDYDSNLGEDLSRVTTPLSAKSADVWSLRNVATSTGALIKFEYESDSYNDAVLQNAHAFIVKKVSVLSCESSDPESNPREIEGDQIVIPDENSGPPEQVKCSYKFEIHNEGIDLRSLYSIDQNVTCVLPYSYSYLENGYSHNINTHSSSFRVTSIAQDYIVGEVSLPEGSLLYGASIFFNFSGNVGFQGGGYRVKSVTVNDLLLSKVSTTEYDYNFAGVSSGVTSYEPNIFDKVKLTGNNAALEKVAIKAVKNVTTNNILKFAREVPAPGVMYKYVTVKDHIENGNVKSELGNKSRYEFIVVDDKMVGFTSSTQPSGAAGTKDGISYQTVRKSDFVLKDLTANIGKLKAITLFDKMGMEVTSTTYTYLYDEIDQDYTNNLQLSQQYQNLLQPYSYQGVLQETTWDGSYIRKSNGTYDLQGVISRRHVYPSLLLRETNYNHKTGITTVSKNLGYDFYTGQVNKLLYFDGYGNSYLTENKPAYRVESYKSGMGLYALGGKNMLTQDAYSVTYKVNPNDYAIKMGVVAASAQTWSDKIEALRTETSGVTRSEQSGIWRKRASYSFVGDPTVAATTDGLVPIAGFSDFTSWTGASAAPDKWQKNSEITLYDVQSHAMEASDMNDLFAATKFDAKHERVFATVANASYNEFAYSGAEDELVDGKFGGEVIQTGVVSTDKAHTGTKSLKVTAAGGTAFRYTAVPKESRSFLVSVWSDRSNGQIKYKVNGVTTPALLKPVRQAGGWYLLNATIPAVSAGTSLEIWGEASVANTYFDDFRVYPNDASMTSYVYNSWGELTHILDANNLYTEFKYDDIGRLKSTNRETLQSQYGVSGIVQVSQIDYNYGALTPEQVSITASITGSTGSVSPSGIVNVLQGKEDKSFVFVENCPSPKLQNVFIDGKVLNLSLAKTVLFDGTEVLVSGKTITFRNVQSNHSISGEFYTQSASSGMAYCYINAQGCRDGSYEYYYYDICGNPGTRYRVWDLASIPEGLRTMIPAEGCPVTSGGDCPGVQQQ